MTYYAVGLRHEPRQIHLSREFKNTLRMTADTPRGGWEKAVP
jgi:hypothetical protein